MKLIKKFLQWYKDKYHINIDFHFTDNHSLKVIKVFSCENGELTNEPLLNFGTFTWIPNLAIPQSEPFDVEEAISYIERCFEEETGWTLWTEVDILNRIRRVLQKGKSDTVVIPWGVFKRYRINIKFSNEA